MYHVHVFICSRIKSCVLSCCRRSGIMGKRKRLHRSALDGTGGLGYKQHVSLQAGGGSGASGPTHTPTKSFLAEWLLSEVMWGLMAPQRAQQIALLAWTDGARGGELDRLRNMGSQGDRRTSNHEHANRQNNSINATHIHIYIHILVFVLQICVRCLSTTEVHGGEMFGGIWSNAFVLVSYSQ